MKLVKAFCLVLTCAVVLSSCAGSYHQIYPRSLEYSYATAAQAPVTLGYRYDVLSQRGNKKFARKEEKNNIQLMAVQLTNNTSTPLVFGRDIQLTNNNVVVNPLPSGLVHKQLKQQAPLFLLYLLMSPMKVTVTKATNGFVTEQSVYPVGLILGPALGVGNMVVASGNNQKFQAELLQHDLVGRIIQPGETVYGLVGVGHTGYAPLSVRLVDTATSTDQELD
ncbi:hypothetical protein [Cesiribacter andamanensis]|uniref:Uncharacterized protein n=1 Tax=Cesiribacter andamanensis AMV16 TaxID=1279009 RepID=M7NZ60_9BACT|nr:hypothetical protein [Cesiribacter andamanensis]EMR03644.1 hypothetical protein ADICEAN_01241 [Cesiribacter andamanensis AMV16]